MIKRVACDCLVSILPYRFTHQRMQVKRGQSVQFPSVISSGVSYGGILFLVLTFILKSSWSSQILDVCNKCVNHHVCRCFVAVIISAGARYFNIGTLTLLEE